MIEIYIFTNGHDSRQKYNIKKKKKMKKKEEHKIRLNHWKSIFVEKRLQNWHATQPPIYTTTSAELFFLSFRKKKVQKRKLQHCALIAEKNNIYICVCVCVCVHEIVFVGKAHRV